MNTLANALAATSSPLGNLGFGLSHLFPGIQAALRCPACGQTIGYVGGLPDYRLVPTGSGYWANALSPIEAQMVQRAQFDAATRYALSRLRVDAGVFRDDLGRPIKVEAVGR